VHPGLNPDKLEFTEAEVQDAGNRFGSQTLAPVRLSYIVAELGPLFPMDVLVPDAADECIGTF
jgi:hypothetical protein